MESRSDDSRDDRPRVPWERAASFVDEVSGIAVNVQKLPLRRPVYSFEVCRIHNGQPTRWFRPPVTINNGTVTLEPIGMIVSSLIEKAENFIQEAMQFDIDNGAPLPSTGRRPGGDGGGRCVRKRGLSNLRWHGDDD